MTHIHLLYFVNKKKKKKKNEGSLWIKVSIHIGPLYDSFKKHLPQGKEKRHKKYE